MGLISAFFLLLSPRIFADAFYNSKDSPCMALYIIAIYTLIKFLNHKSIRWASFHALSCALLISIRIVGILVPVLTFGFMFMAVWQAFKQKEHIKPILKSFLIYSILLCVLIYLFWPYIWFDPISKFLEAFSEMSRYPWPGFILYMGEYIKPKDLMWHYIPVWILISTPLYYVLLFIIGLFSTPLTFIRHRYLSIFIDIFPKHLNHSLLVVSPNFGYHYASLHRV